MEQDSGWVEVLDPDTNGEVARAHLVIERRERGDSAWEGELRSVRAVNAGLAAGRYMLRFESGTEVCCVEVEWSVDPPRVRGRELPAVLSELHVGE